MAYLGRPGATAPLTSADIPDNSITAAKIVDATIVAADLAPDSVGTSEIADSVTLVTPNIGTPSAGVVTNLSGVLPVGVTGGSGLDKLKLARNYDLNLSKVSASTVDIDAGYLTLFDSSNSSVILGTGVASTACNLTLDQDNDSAGGGSNGVLGLDTGSFANSTFYYIYVIYNGSATSCVASLAPNWISTTNDGSAGSTKGVDKTNISGYTYGKYVGHVYQKSDGNFADFWQHDNFVTPDAIEVFSVNSSSDTEISLAEFLPPTAWRMYLFCEMWEVDGSGSHVVQRTKSWIRPNATGSDYGRVFIGFQKNEDDIGYMYDQDHVCVTFAKQNLLMWVATYATYYCKGHMRGIEYQGIV